MGYKRANTRKISVICNCGLDAVDIKLLDDIFPNFQAYPFLNCILIAAPEACNNGLFCNLLQFWRTERYYEAREVALKLFGSYVQSFKAPVCKFQAKSWYSMMYMQDTDYGSRICMKCRQYGMLTKWFLPSELKLYFLQFISLTELDRSDRSLVSLA